MDVFYLIKTTIRCTSSASFVNDKLVCSDYIPKIPVIIYMLYLQIFFLKLVFSF